MSKWTRWFRTVRPAKPAMVSVAPVEGRPLARAARFSRCTSTSRTGTRRWSSSRSLKSKTSSALRCRRRLGRIARGGRWPIRIRPRARTRMPGNRRGGPRCRIYWRTPSCSSGCRNRLYSESVGATDPASLNSPLRVHPDQSAAQPDLRATHRRATGLSDRSPT